MAIEGYLVRPFPSVSGGGGTHMLRGLERAELNVEREGTERREKERGYCQRGGWRRVKAMQLITGAGICPPG